jgi:hypothetical protein
MHIPIQRALKDLIVTLLSRVRFKGSIWEGRDSVSRGVRNKKEMLFRETDESAQDQTINSGIDK